MIYSVTRIDEADYGCEDRMPGEPTQVLLTDFDEDGKPEKALDGDED